MREWLEATAELPWVDRPTLMSGVVGYVAVPGQSHKVYSEDGGESWYVAFGVPMSKKWVALTSTPVAKRKLTFLDRVRNLLGK